jgi:hypothetical protein
MIDKLELAYSAIGAALSDDEIKDLVKKSTGMNLTDIVSERDPPKKKIEKVIDFLKNRGNQRWLLTRVLLHAYAEKTARAKETRETIVDAFPETLIRLPRADNLVMSALGYLQKLLTFPLPADLKYRLLPSRRNFDRMRHSIFALFAYKSLQESFLKLLFTLNASEELLANPLEGLAPDLKSLANQMDQTVDQAPTALALLGAGARPENADLVRLTELAASLRAAADTPEDAANTIDDIQRLVRKNLAQLNSDIIRAVQELSFDALTDELPSKLREMQARKEFQELVQAIRDVTATVLARALKSKMWQDAEDQMSLISKCFGLQDDAAAIAEQWFEVRERIDWLAELEPDEGWAAEARKYALEIEDELFQEKKLDDNVRLRFEAYRSWFRGPFLKIDDTTKLDFGSLYQLGDPFKKILSELGR